MKPDISLSQSWRMLAGSAYQAIGIIRALLIREMMVRYKREGLGFGWVVLEPIILAGCVMVSWRLMYGPNNHGVSVVPLVLTGYTCLTLWRNIVGRSVLALKTCVDLKYHRSVQYGDVILARFILEALAALSAFWIVYILLYLIDLVPPIYDLSLVTIGWLLFIFFSIGVGFIIVALTELREGSEHFIPPISYITIPLTGAFVMVHWVPEVAQTVLLWSPLVHAVEMLRGGVFGPSVPTSFDTFFLFLSGLLVNGVGWILFNIAKTRVEPLV
jgi:capsular polysaccharide transport system permease protein